ncbi:GTPase ObgE [candidate division KSB1 bacterium]|nr:GTPase ObgE [candidate division KSB1 bacterium]NIR72992.1 GTPase ObgE [candidate division KSB1 bacterium]NIS27745.1 GTPase ObgE [candidate division KSB1 bacterium]NIT74593.1 GTPase ObgE [candidate division KSB1 bacterium]NIU28412.1 GTPase ObgE [candidate division KSB1 bacterium]
MFVDRAKIRVRAGAGGSGCVSFRREKYVAKGGPDGGDGGEGGDVILVADPKLSTLLDFKNRPVFHAQRAQHGKGSNKHGKNGEDLVIKVPLGTVVKEVGFGDILGDLVEVGQRLVVAKGGRGGRGNARFVSSTNQAPRKWEPGEYGEEKEVELELKLIADVGLVGLPNAGKSTLLSRLSAATPKIADYPFTTLSPNLGVVKYRDVGSFVIADIPGLIEGAHLGKGLGTEFLRHIERTKILIILLDCSRDCLQQDYDILKQEMKEYNVQLVDRSQIVVLTKIDLCPNLDFSEFEASLSVPVCKISSVTGFGLAQLNDLMWEHLQATSS